VIPNRGAAKFKIIAFLFKFYYIECQKLSFFTQQGCHQFFSDLSVPQAKKG
jgi:hypothetical protein